jgi:hypothetical protein
MHKHHEIKSYKISKIVEKNHWNCKWSFKEPGWYPSFSDTSPGLAVKNFMKIKWGYTHLFIHSFILKTHWVTASY